MKFSRVTSRERLEFSGQPAAKKAETLRGNQQKKGWNSQEQPAEKRLKFSRVTSKERLESSGVTSRERLEFSGATSSKKA
jgi:hypothetical protein